MRWSAVALGIPLAIILGAVLYYAPQTITYYKLRPALLRPNSDPPRGWSSVPGPLVDTTVSTAEGTSISQFGMKFEVPWQAIEMERYDRCSAEIVFKSKQAVKFNNPDCIDRTPISSYPFLNPEDVRLAFPSERRESKYEQYRAVISAKPSQLSPLLSHQDFAHVRVLLDIKGAWFEHNPEVPTILSFAENEYRGFEIRSLSPEGQYITLDLFDRTGQRWFTVVVMGRGANLTQPEINRIINSFGTASSSESKPSKE